MREDVLLWLVVVGFTLAVWLLEQVKAAQARRQRAATAPPPVPIPPPITTAAPVPVTPVLPSRPAAPRPARRPRPMVTPSARRRLHLTPGTARQGIVLATILGPCRGLE